MASSNSINKLSFVHIPKTAGISLHSELERHFGKDKTIRFGDKKSRDLFLSMTSEQLKKYDYITGHITVSELLQKNINYPTISVMRDPLKRLISMQHYMTNSNFKDHQGCNFKDFDDFLKYMFSNRSFNAQCWHLGGKAKFQLAVESIINNNIYVVPLEYYQDLIETLSDLLGGNLVNIHKNITRYNTGVDNSQYLGHHLLESLIGDDVKLFSYVKENYEGLKQAFVKQFEI